MSYTTPPSRDWAPIASLVEQVGPAEAGRRLGMSREAIRSGVRRFKGRGVTDPLPAPGTPVLEAPRASDRRVIRSVMLTDVHVPYQHRRNVECALSVIREVQPDETDLLGDIMELESLSKHAKSRPDRAQLAEEFRETNLFLDAIQSANRGRTTRYLEGNHCSRASRYEAEEGELAEMLSVPKSLYLLPRSDYHRETSNLRGIEWIPLRSQPYIVRNSALLHGVYEAQFHAYMNALHLGPTTGVRYIFSGHMHGWQSFTSPAGCTAFALPWLGDRNRHVFQAYVKGKPRPWNSGLVIREDYGSLTTVTPVFIEDGRALFGGQIIEGRK